MPAKKYLRDIEVGQRFGVHRVTPWRWAADEKNPFPKPVRIGPQCVRWRLEDIEAFEAEIGRDAA